jgi:hypothetical protein
MRLTANHVREFVGVSRTDFQRWLTVLPPYAGQQTTARKARVFEARDLVFFAVVRFLTAEVGLRLDAIAGFSQCMRSDLTKLSDLSIETRRIALEYSREKGWLMDSNDLTESELSLGVDVTRIWFQVHQFLGLTSNWEQSNLPLGLMALNAESHIAIRKLGV